MGEPSLPLFSSGADAATFDGTLNDEQIAAVLAYIKSRWPADIRERQARINQEAGNE